MSTTGKKPDHLCQGQHWFVKINGSVSLLSAEIIDITACTVALMEPGNFDLAARYKLDDVEFVEQIVGPDAIGITRVKEPTVAITFATKR